MGKKGFSKGYDANRFVHVNNGITVFRETLAEHMRNLSLEAVSYVHQVLNDKAQSPKLRVICAEIIMNRAWGQPANAMTIKLLDETKERSVEDLSMEELNQLIAEAPETQAILAKNKSIELVVNEAGVYSNVDAEKSLKASGVD